jgi:hypothetical protein
MWVGGQSHAPAALPSGKRPVIHRTGGRVGLRVDLGNCVKCLPHRISDPEPSSPSRVAPPTVLPRPLCGYMYKVCMSFVSVTCAVRPAWLTRLSIRVLLDTVQSRKMSCKYKTQCRSQWPRGLRRGSAAVRLLGLRVRIPARACMCLLWVFGGCQVEVSASGWSLVQRSPTECGVCLSVIVRPR